MGAGSLECPWHRLVTDPLEARRVAADVVGRVLRSGAYSNVLLDSSTRSQAATDRARTKALTYGVLRRLETIDAAIEKGADRSTTDIDQGFVDRLRVSTFELLYSNVPTPVAVSAGVDLVKERNSRAAGFANAVLRRVSERPLPDDEVHSLELPGWLESDLTGEWDPAEIAAFAIDSGNDPGRTVRFDRDADPVGHPVDDIEGAYRIEAGPLPPGCHVQDAASIAVGNSVDAAPGMTVADIAAAPGGKAAHLRDQVGADGLVLAVDSHQRRVSDGRRRMPDIHWVVADARTPPFAKASFQRVLLDAPCSGLGTLRRRPEIRLRVQHSDIERLAALQREMVEAALELVAPGGRLVYSVCTVTPQETIEVTEPYDFKPAPVPGRIWGKGTLMAPHLTGTDGMFVAIHDL